MTDVAGNQNIFNGGKATLSLCKAECLTSGYTCQVQPGEAERAQFAAELAARKAEAERARVAAKIAAAQAKLAKKWAYCLTNTAKLTLLWWFRT